MNTMTAVPVSFLRTSDRHPGSLSVDASDLGWRPGCWPAALPIVDANDSRVSLSRARPVRNVYGELTHVWYIGHSSAGVPLQVAVWND